MSIYTEKVLEHFKNPRNQGKLKDYDTFGEKGNPVCGDVLKFYIKVKNDKIIDIGWETMGCAAAIATTSMLSEMAKGKTLDEALKLTKEDVADELEGLPPVKMHCSNLAADALHEAIQKYREKHKKKKTK
jgi:nitrogen fixation NifU-like protein